MHLRLLVPALSACLLLCHLGMAQETGRTEKVSLRKDQSLQIFLETIKEAKKQKEWDEALTALKEIERFVEKNGEDYILPVSSIKAQGALLYTSAREAAYRELATFPQHVLSSWRLGADAAVRSAPVSYTHLTLPTN